MNGLIALGAGIAALTGIGGGIGIFVAYIGFLNVGFVNFGSGVPAMATLNTNVLWLFIIGLVITIVLLVLNVKGAILIGIVATAIIGIPMQVTSLGSSISFTEACQQLPTTFGAIFTSAGLPSLFSDAAKIPLVLITIFAFSISDTFDTIGGTATSLGVKENAVELPTTDSSWRFETFSVEEYEGLYQQMVDGTLVVDNDYSKLETTEWSNLTLNVI